MSKTRKNYIWYYTITLSVVATLVSILFYYVAQNFEFKPFYFVGIFILNLLLIYLLFTRQLNKILFSRIREVYENTSFLNNENIENDPLDLEIDRLTARLENFAKSSKGQIKVLQERESYRREFIGNVAHELRTPLFTAQSFVLTLMEGAGEDDKIRDDYLKRVSRSIDRLVNIVEDLSLISELESGKISLNLSTFDLNKVLLDMRDLFEVKANEEDIQLQIKIPNTPTMVEADMARVEQILVNLINNALKHGKENGFVKVWIEDMGSNVQVNVEDDGVGIPEEHLSRIFERFYKVDKSRTRRRGSGSGLGLSIVKHLIEAHQQTVSVESEEGEGALFSFTLAKKS